MSRTIKGHCLCGDVEVSVKDVGKSVGACHCGMCRRWTGGPFMVVDCGDRVQLAGEERISVFDSSEWAERGFCSRCGTHLFYRLKQQGTYFVPVGLLEAGDWIFDHQVFVDEQPSFYAFANDTNNMTGPELFAQYAPPSS